MKVYEINPSNFGKYKDQLHNIMSKPNMCGVFSNSCGHCEAMKPEWNKLKSAIISDDGNGSLVEIDSNVLPEFDYQPLREKISGYPTILVLKNGIPKMEYSGNRSFEDMYNFFNKNVNNTPPQYMSNKEIPKKIKKSIRKARRKSRRKRRKSKNKKGGTIIKKLRNKRYKTMKKN